MPRVICTRAVTLTGQRPFEQLVVVRRHDSSKQPNGRRMRPGRRGLSGRLDERLHQCQQLVTTAKRREKVGKSGEDHPVGAVLLIPRHNKIERAES
jgi:hypothetical protein